MNLHPFLKLNSISLSHPEIVFIDRGVDDYDVLVRGVRPGVEVHLLEADALAQMTAVLVGRTDLKAVHVVSHGAPGCLYLGEGELSLGTLAQHKAALRSWFAGYGEGEKPALLLYGCNVAAGDAGEEFLSQLATLTGVIAQASSVKVGAPKAGGVWQLDYGQSSIHAVDLFSVEIQEIYSAAFAPGTLDMSFGNLDSIPFLLGIVDGQAITVDSQAITDIDPNSFELASTITLDAAGNILVGGLTNDMRSLTGIDFALASYTNDGQLNTSFGNGGIVSTDFGGDNPFIEDVARSVTTDAVGNILLGGHTRGRNETFFEVIDFALARYTSDGQLDTSFGDGGKVTTDFGGETLTDDFGVSITTDAASNILVAGYTRDRFRPTNQDLALARYTTNGQLDTSFGTGGKVTTDFLGYVVGASVLVDTVDNILVAGTTIEFSNNSSNIRDVSIARYTSNGQLDTSFGTGGKVSAGFSGFSPEEGEKVTLDAAGNILVVGTDFNDSTFGDIALVRYTSDGQLDTSFGIGGKVTTDFNGRSESATSITTDLAGNILVSGRSRSIGQNNSDSHLLVRYNSSGVLDSSFGTEGNVITPFFIGRDSAPSNLLYNRGLDIVTDAAGDIFVAGAVPFIPSEGFERIDAQLGVIEEFAVAKFKGGPDAPKVGITWNQQTGVVSFLSFEAVTGAATLDSTERTITDTSWALKTLGDLDGDGQEDVLLRHAVSGETLAFFLTPGGQSIQSEALIGRDVKDPNWNIVGTGDFNADGKTDIIWQNQAADQILAWYMDGQGGIESEAVIGRDLDDSNWEIEAIADFNGDGKSDMVLRNGESGQNLLWEMDGSTILVERLIGRDVPDQDWHIEGAKDFDNDGTVDLFLRHRGVGQGLLWSMTDSGTIASEQLITNVPTGVSQLLV